MRRIIIRWSQTRRPARGSRPPRYTSGAKLRLSSTSRTHAAARASAVLKSRKPRLTGLFQLAGPVAGEEHHGRAGLSHLSPRFVLRPVATGRSGSVISYHSWAAVFVRRRAVRQSPWVRSAGASVPGAHQVRCETGHGLPAQEHAAAGAALVRAIDGVIDAESEFTYAIDGTKLPHAPDTTDY